MLPWKKIDQVGRGAILYLRQEGRGIGLKKN
ncbi:GTP cyclohydrolase II/3,4-dihydroxy-2-butanone4-phosphate synthase [Streptococcus infantarius subsp. infantarius]|nr:GTP cyclohydrolase II/3,4-dihydroxy-2-butanone4-phosphate synthase [Streptococcus infantarius subsp. infantarius]MCO4638231.1 GTP cyclohydrolase II/3,4-dihydroxy-2-butanone4-phosphate synthase [Streptococcus infantarius subsp. infantarius]MCO4641593.1 GTP cyclohydrolase II/3,4-dihydroxy-2-butanone4-phosphate synthase [Streptococcus infantarius subsp. infantarius]MCO4644079.1 GTP cyclohydrolase II/3,4-dihydroxy-2-butanone4-phosphate synthase [Streptococcus infantarius subsp. infantarius]MCO46